MIKQSGNIIYLNTGSEIDPCWAIVPYNFESKSPDWDMSNPSHQVIKNKWDSLGSIPDFNLVEVSIPVQPNLKGFNQDFVESGEGRDLLNAIAAYDENARTVIMLAWNNAALTNDASFAVEQWNKIIVNIAVQNAWIIKIRELQAEHHIALVTADNGVLSAT